MNELNNLSILHLINECEKVHTYASYLCENFGGSFEEINHSCTIPLNAIESANIPATKAM